MPSNITLISITLNTLLYLGITLNMNLRRVLSLTDAPWPRRLLQAWSRLWTASTQPTGSPSTRPAWSPSPSPTTRCAPSTRSTRCRRPVSRGPARRVRPCSALRRGSACPSCAPHSPTTRSCLPGRQPSPSCGCSTRPAWSTATPSSSSCTWSVTGGGWATRAFLRRRLGEGRPGVDRAGD